MSDYLNRLCWYAYIYIYIATSFGNESELKAKNGNKLTHVTLSCHNFTINHKGD